MPSKMLDKVMLMQMRKDLWVCILPMFWYFGKVEHRANELVYSPDISRQHNTIDMIQTLLEILHLP